MPTDPQHFKWKADNDFKKNTIISTILVQLTFFSHLQHVSGNKAIFILHLTFNFSLFFTLSGRESYTLIVAGRFSVKEKIDVLN